MSARDTEVVLKPLRYEQMRWGDLVEGTKAQLQAIGLGVGACFPGEPGGPKRSFHVTDARGFPSKIEKVDAPGRFKVWISFPDRDARPSLDEKLEHSRGVTLKRSPAYDRYSGRPDDLVAAGLCRRDHFPGMPSMRKMRVTILTDGSAASGPPTAKIASSRIAMQIESDRKGQFVISVQVSEVERKARWEAYRAREREWEKHVDSLPRPAPLCEPTDMASGRRQPEVERPENERMRAAAYYVVNGVLPDWAPTPVLAEMGVLHRRKLPAGWRVVQGARAP